MRLSQFRKLFVCCFCAAGALSACTATPHEMLLDEIDLADERALAAIKSDLTAPERAALTNYVLFHWPDSQYYCGEVADRLGETPKTIGQAIRLTLTEQERLQKARRGIESPVLETALRQSDEQQVIDRMEMLELQRHGLEPDSASRKAIERELDMLRDRRARLQQAVTPL